MALRTPDFHTVSPDGVAQDRAAMEQYTTGLLNGIKKWNTIELTIDDLEIAGDTAIVTLSQHLDRMALRPDNQVHDVGTWAVIIDTPARLARRRVRARRYDRRDQRLSTLRDSRQDRRGAT